MRRAPCASHFASRDPLTAARAGTVFEACGLPEGMVEIAKHHGKRSGGAAEEKAAWWYGQAARAGYGKPWYRAAMNRAGRTDLEIAWPHLYGLDIVTGWPAAREGADDDDDGYQGRGTRQLGS